MQGKRITEDVFCRIFTTTMYSGTKCNLTFPESDPGDNNEFIDSTIEKMYAKDRQRLNMLKQPTTSHSPCKPVAAVVGTNISHPGDTTDQTTSVQATSDVSQVQNNLSDFISSLSLTGNTETKPDSNSLGNETFSGLLPAPSLESNTIPGVPQLTVNPLQLQHQMQMQMQLLQCQQLMLQSMSAYGASVGNSGMPNMNYSMAGVGAGVSTANIQSSQDAKSSSDAALDMVTSALILNPTLGRGSHSTNIRPPPGGFQKRN